MNTVTKTMALGVLALAMSTTSIVARADDQTTGKKMQEATEDAVKNVKKAGRDVKQKGCEMINGKLECVGKKIGNKVKDVKDEVKDKSNDGETKAH